ncbi:putative FCP1 domain, HAD superfamily protein [Helianthus annuus]|nr:putative FCP1 domain, HAD superfamily protein [Helianthus annuus]
MCLYVICVYAVYRRPFCQEFLELCFQRFQVGIWSSAMELIYGFWFWYFSVILPCRYHTSIIVTRGGLRITQDRLEKKLETSRALSSPSRA